MKTMQFVADQPYLYARYARMSSRGQNPRSPEQQFDNLASTLQRLGHPWVHVRDFRDDAISGRYIWKRPGFRQMMTEIRAGVVKVDLLLVDTLERFGRSDDILPIRRDLEIRHGILVLTADSNFADPTTVQGRALTFADNMRATGDAHTKRNDVLRAKRMVAAKDRHWPGGPAPLGYMLQSALKKTASGQEVVDYCVLVPDPATRWMAVLIFETARDTGWGTTRLAQFLNSHPDIPDRYKPFWPDSIGYIIDNTAYFGTLTWARNSTGIAADTRWVRRNPDDMVLTVPDFCEPLVSRELWDAVQEARRSRSQALMRARSRDDDGKRIKPLVPGITLKYPLTGLVRCGECGRSMQPLSSTGASTTGRKYAYYRCPGAGARACPNRHYVRETWLREAVTARLRERLFPSPERAGQIPAWFPPFVGKVEAELKRRREGEGPQRPDLGHELTELTRKLAGWRQTLGDPDIPHAVRSDIQTEYGVARKRLQEIEVAKAEWEAGVEQLDRLLDPKQVLDRLHDLAETLAGGNPTSLNAELSRHIEGIFCHEDGRVVMRTRSVGLFEGLPEPLSQQKDAGHRRDVLAGQAVDVKRITPRRRGKLRIVPAAEVVASTSPPEEGRPDPARFASLADQFIWRDVSCALRGSCWSRDHALEVEQVHRETGLSFAKLAERFGVSRPTIRRALKLAGEIRAESTDRSEPPASLDAATD